MKDVLLLVGAGQIGMAITRRIGFDKKIIIGDKNLGYWRISALSSMISSLFPVS